MTILNRESRRVPLLMIVLLLLGVTGCASQPKRTAGTSNLGPEQLAIVYIKPHQALTAWKGQPVHIESFYVGEAQYLVPRDQSFYVLPGDHTFTIDYGPCVHGWAKVEAPFNIDSAVFEGPYGRFAAALEPGRQYEVVASPELSGNNAVQTRHNLREIEPATNLD